MCNRKQSTPSKKKWTVFYQVCAKTVKKRAFARSRARKVMEEETTKKMHYIFNCSDTLLTETQWSMELPFQKKYTKL